MIKILGWQRGVSNVSQGASRLLIGLSMALACSIMFPLSASATSSGPVETAPTPPAQVRGLGNSGIELQNGTFTQDIPIAAPEFHGVTPHLSLHYSSSGRDDFVGVGWKVSGFSVIEREFFGGQARYLLDGEPLMTDYSGAYKTVRQPFDRISKYGAGWQVIRPDGVVMTYSPVFINSQDVDATVWGLTNVTDPHNNTATYSWSCTYASSYYDKLQCYPSSVTYADVTISFNVDTQTRPATDQPTFATGGPIIGQLTNRLGSITVTVSGATVRSYQLSYTTSARTGRSLLNSVQPSGGGITLPATTLTWSDVPSGFSYQQDISYSYGLSPTIWYGAQTFTGDFNGDGREDMIVRSTDKHAVYMLQGNGSGGFLNAVDISSQLDASGILGIGSSMLPYTSIYVGDFNGDGKQDLLLLVPYSQVAINYQQYHAYILTATANSYGSTFFNPPVEVTSSTQLTPYQWGTGRLIIADFDGDGLSDVLFPDINNADTSGSSYPTYWAAVATMNANGSFNPKTTIPSQPTMSQNDWHLSQFTALDLNGAGRSALLARVTTSAGPAQRAILFEEQAPSSGVGMFGNGVDVTNAYGMSSTIWQCSLPIPGDFNGDGHTDLLVQQSRSCVNNSGIQPTYLLYANGDATVPQFSTHLAFADKIDVTNIPGMSDDKWRNADIFTGDFDGDGKTDLLLRRAVNAYSPGNGTLLLRSTGSGFQTPVDITNAYGMSYDKWTNVIRVGDFNGDSIDDIFVQDDVPSGSSFRPLIMASSSSGNVITGVSNGYGATTTVTYLPSTTWVNSNNPPRMQTVTSVTVTDGRISDPSQAQVTNYSYSGAAWDPVERRALGFRYAKATYPNDPTQAYEQSYFYQGAAYEVGELQEHDLYGLGGTQLTQTVRTLTGSTTAPWVRNLAQQDDTECDGACKTVRKTYSYDSYGDVLVLNELGDTSVTGDERTTTYTYTSVGYIVNAPTDIAVRQGSSTGTVLKETKYSNFTSGGDPQTIQSWLNAENQ
jgi:hypothetical protein